MHDGIVDIERISGFRSKAGFISAFSEKLPTMTRKLYKSVCHVRNFKSAERLNTSVRFEIIHHGIFQIGVKPTFQMKIVRNKRTNNIKKQNFQEYYYNLFQGRESKNVQMF